MVDGEMIAVGTEGGRPGGGRVRTEGEILGCLGSADEVSLSQVVPNGREEIEGLSIFDAFGDDPQAQRVAKVNG
ncbi:MAG TPA: hypothetical protein VIJ09_06620 [Acidimicrobiales bacterium]